MSAEPRSKLYSPQILGLAAQLARYPLSDACALRFTARSQTCGSVVSIGLELDEDAAVRAIGLQVTACAVGQAAAAILAEGIIGQTERQIEAAERSILRWLKNEGDAPDWPGFEALLPIQDYKGRHGAAMLPWQAASGALSLAHAAS